MRRNGRKSGRPRRAHLRWEQKAPLLTRLLLAFLSPSQPCRRYSVRSTSRDIALGSTVFLHTYEKPQTAGRYFAAANMKVLTLGPNVPTSYEGNTELSLSLLLVGIIFDDLFFLLLSFSVISFFVDTSQNRALK